MAILLERRHGFAHSLFRRPPEPPTEGLAMRPTAAPHPADTDLAAFALGKLPPGTAETVRSHVEACETCRAAVERTPPDSFVGLLRAARPGPAATTPQVLKGDTAGPSPSVLTVPPELRDHPRYKLLRELGRGGMGVVYLAE